MYAVPLLILTNFGLAMSPSMRVVLLVRFVQGIVNFGVFTVIYIISETTVGSILRTTF